MTSDRETQAVFFDWLKQNRGETSLVNELESVLSISRDSAYRRLRGDTLLTFNEIIKISSHFGISLDQYFNTNISSVTFQSRHLKDDFTFQSYLYSIYESLKLVGKASGYQLTYLAKDIPIFHYFQFSRLTTFKIFFWLKTIINDPVYQGEVYHQSIISKDLLNLAAEIWHHFKLIRSVEIWSDEIVNVTIRQIKYYFEVGIIKKEDALDVLEDLENMVIHLNDEAVSGKKSSFGRTENLSLNGDFVLYINEVEIGDNTILFDLDSKRTVFKTYNMLNTLQTSDQRFCKETEDHIQGLIEKSTLISKSAEKERTRFFQSMQSKLDQLHRFIESHTA